LTQAKLALEAIEEEARAEAPVSIAALQDEKRVGCYWTILGILNKY
jgi:hypothetical protein